MLMQVVIVFTFSFSCFLALFYFLMIVTKRRYLNFLTYEIITSSTTNDSFGKSINKHLKGKSKNVNEVLLCLIKIVSEIT